MNKPGTQRRAYVAQISLLDDAIGETLAAVRETGRTERTLVFFFSDNGGPTSVGANNHPLRGMKGTTYEGGVRVPFVVSWPGKLPPGRDYPQPVSTLDVFPTALACAGVPMPADQPRDGVNLIPYLTGAQAGPPHRQLCWREEERGHWGLRDGALKLVRRTMERAGQTPALGSLPQPAWELFDLAADLREADNLATARAGEANRLNAQLDAWCRQAAPLAFTGIRGKETAHPAPPQGAKPSAPEKRGNHPATYS